MVWLAFGHSSIILIILLYGDFSLRIHLTHKDNRLPTTSGARKLKAKARSFRGQGQRVLSLRCPTGRGELSRTDLWPSGSFRAWEGRRKILPVFIRA